MFKNLFMTMDYVTFMKWQFAAMASGAALIGTWWMTPVTKALLRERR
jgi:hypothetical protein